MPPARPPGTIRRHPDIPAGPGEEDGVGAVENLLATGPLPTAVIAFNDRCAIGAIAALTRAGVQVPHDMSVVGYDDSRLARISYIDLTTVGQNPRQLADLAVHRAIDRLENHPVARRDQVLGPQFVIRSSTAHRRGNHNPDEIRRSGGERLRLELSNSAWVMAPESSRDLAEAIWSAALVEECRPRT